MKWLSILLLAVAELVAKQLPTAVPELKAAMKR